jgi:hypothetical protein
MNRTLLALVAALSIALAGAAVGAGPDEASQRSALAQRIVEKWSAHVSQNYAISADTWAFEMAPAFAEASIDDLWAAAGARSFEDMNRVLLGAESRDATLALGDPATDLVFVPVTPCRLFDTRLAGGPIPAESVRAFDVNGIGLGFQGGSSGDCSGSGGAAFAAAVVNLTVVAPGGAGYITAYPLDAPQPLASSLNYTAGAIVGNEVVVKLDQSAGVMDLNVYSYAQTHLVGDLVGYFAAPRATPLECTEKSAVSGTITVGNLAYVTTPSCDAGYTATSGGCAGSSSSGRLALDRTLANSHACTFINEGPGNLTGTSYVRCCRIPGR